jgi:hypothetical protein
MTPLIPTLLILALLHAVADPLKTGYSATVWSRMKWQKYFDPHQRVFVLPGWFGYVLSDIILIWITDFWHTLRALQILTVIVGMWWGTGEPLWVWLVLLLPAYSIMFETVYRMTLRK